MSDVLSKHIHTIDLLDTYSALLTPKQKTIMTHYFYDNYTLGEIAELFNISRNAVHDQVKRVTEKLKGYEMKLGLLQSKETRSALLKKLAQTENDPKIIRIIEALKKVM